MTNRFPANVKQRRRVRKPLEEVVQHAQFTIESFLDKPEMGRNEIFEKVQVLGQTGFHYKRDTLDAITYLEDMKVLGRNKDVHHSQKLVNKLTVFGTKIAMLRRDIKNFIESFDRLAEGYKKLYSQGYGKTLNQEDREYLKLLTQEYNSVQKAKDILKERRNPNLPIRIILLQQLTSYLLSILIYRYQELIIEAQNELVRTFINKIVIDFVVQIITRIQLSFTLPGEEIDPITFIQSITSKATESVEMGATFGAFVYKPINKEVEEFITSFIQILQPAELLREDWLEKMKIRWRGTSDDTKWEGYDDPDYGSSDPYWAKHLVDLYHKLFNKISP